MNDVYLYEGCYYFNSERINCPHDSNECFPQNVFLMMSKSRTQITTIIVQISGTLKIWFSKADGYLDDIKTTVLVKKSKSETKGRHDNVHIFIMTITDNARSRKRKLDETDIDMEDVVNSHTFKSKSGYNMKINRNDDTFSSRKNSTDY